nr:putative cytochrome P450 hydroxylase [Kibdelosporangium sp. MJ126-NF4]
MVAALPVTRPAGCPFDPPEELSQLREQRPVTRLAFPNGHVGWLVTGHAEARAVLADRRFSSRYELMHYPLPGVDELPPAPVGDLTGIDPPEHTRYRKLLTGKFTTRRMSLLADRIEEVTLEHLDAMALQGPPVDLVKVFAQPVPAVMICELLGVPYVHRETFQRHALVLASPDTSPEEMYGAYTGVQEYLQELVKAKRAEPTDDLLSDLTASDLTDEELAGIGTFLLGAGLDTTTNMLALGVFALLRHPEQFAVLQADPDIAVRAVEELLRYVNIAHSSLKSALEDVNLDGHEIKAGETVVISVQTANRDPRKFADPDTLDLNRDATGHLAFFHGIHQCLGQQLARTQLRIAIPALVAQFPTLHLAVPPEEVPMRAAHQPIYGVQSLPVAW